MPDPITTAKGLTQPLVGGDNNTWGSLLNTNFALIDSAFGGTLSLPISGNTSLNATQAQNTGFEFSGTLTGNTTVTWPAFSGFVVVQNGTSGGYSLTCGLSSGASVTILSGETVSVWSDGTNFYRLALVGGGVVASATKTSAYSVANNDKRKTLSFGGNNCYTVAIGAASGFDVDFQVRLYNADSGSAKWVAINGYTSFFLWPGQNVVVQNVGGAWLLFPAQQRWRAPPNTRFYVDPSGSDSGGANDGLSQASAFATILNAWTTIRDQTDYLSPIIQLTPGATYNISATIELDGDAPSAFGRLLDILGDETLANPPILSATGSIAAGMIQVRDGLWTGINGVSFVSSTANNTGVFIDQGGLCDMNNCEWNMTSAVFVTCGFNSLCNFTGTQSIGACGGSVLSFATAVSGSSIVFQGVAINGNSHAIDFTGGFVEVDLNSRIMFQSGSSFTGTGSFTGAKYELTHGSFCSQGGLTLPGSAGSADATSAAY